VNYSENITVTGTPRIALALGPNATPTTVYMNYVSGSGTTAITYRYSLDAADFDFDGLPSALNTISLNDGTLLDSGGNAAPTTFTTQDMSGILVTYPEMDLWVTSDFVSKTVTGNPGVSNSGTVTTQACGTGTCRTFNGDDALNLSSALNTAATLFIVVKTPTTAGLGENYDIFGTDVTLQAEFVSSTYNLNTANASVYMDNALVSSGPNHTTAIPTSTTRILQIDYSVTQDYGMGALIGTAFTGAIGEVIVLTGTPSLAKKTEIYNYLNGKY
jgi:hypothetical protein